MADALFVLMRWLHFASFSTLIGGILYGRLVLTPALGTLSRDASEALASKIATAFRPFVVAAIAGLLMSGLYNLLTNPGHSRKYQILLGVKVMLALHVFAAALLVTRPAHPRRARLMSGALISGLIVIAIAAYLRRIY